MNDDCPNGDDCGVHHRVTSRKADDEYEMLSYIDYVGQYAVITTDNPSAMQAQLMADLLGLEFTEQPVFWETCIIHVGHQTVYDAMTAHYSKYGMTVSAEKSAKLWNQGYDEYPDAKGGHPLVVDMLRAGFLELKPSP